MAVSGDSQAIGESCDIAYKEWSGICHALSTGRQSILFRKGGIAEESGVFRPEYPRFWLYPTKLHQQQQGLREAQEFETSTSPDSVPIESLAEVESVWWVDRIETALLLSDHHVWTDETVHKRFFYRTAGLWMISVRVLNLPRIQWIPASPAYLGCKTWVPLESPISMEGLRPVLPDSEAIVRRETFTRIIADASDQR